MKINKCILALLLATVLMGCTSGDTEKSRKINRDYENTSLSAEERALILVNQMTLEEKAGQMTQVARDYLSSLDDIRYYALGSILSGGGSAPSPNNVSSWLEMTGKMQDKALETELRIPILYGSDAVHGHGNLQDAVIFPHHIGLGAADNPDLVRDIARITAIETVATGVRWNFNPCLAVPMDIRWGRTYEGFSSDPQIVNRLGVAELTGAQEGWNSSRAMLATVKHFVADGATDKGLDRGDALIDDDVLREIHLMPYRDAIEAGAMSVMASFSSINGQMMHSNKQLLTDLLKEEWGFRGFVISDWGALKLLPGDSKTQIEAAINGGIDMVMVPDDYKPFIRNLKSLVDEGRISTERIDDAVYRILLAKLEMGLFEFPYGDKELLESVGSDEHRNLARQAVAETQVLLENDGLLPLKGDENILLYGTYGDDIGVQCGGWTLEWQGKAGNHMEGISLLEALESEVGSDNVTFLKEGNELPENISDEYDLMILVTGEEPYAEMKGDNPRPAVKPEHIAAARRADEMGLPVLTVIFSGRPLLLDGMEEHSSALVASWLPGTEGNGITDVLFGHRLFTGRLSFSWPVDERGLVQGLNGDFYLYPRGFGLSTE